MTNDIVNLNFKTKKTRRDKFKKKCVKDGMSMQTVLNALIEDYNENGIIKAVIVRGKDEN